jgi:hypothetical protein
MEFLNTSTGSMPAVIGGEAPQTEAPDSQPSGQGESAQRPKFRVPDLAYKLARVAKKESALLEQQKALEADIGLAKEFKTSKEMAKKDPIKLLQSLGLTFEDIARFQLEGEVAQGNEDPISSLKAQVEEMKQAQLDKEEQAKQQEIERERANHDAQVLTYKKTINDFVEANKDDFEFLAANPDHVDTVYEIIETHFNNTQKILDFKEAAQLVEDELESEFKTKYASLKKIKGLINPSDVVDRQQAPLEFLREPTYQSTRPTSLSNNLKPEVPHRADESSLTAEQRFQRAIEMLDKARGR